MTADEFGEVNQTITIPTSTQASNQPVLSLTRGSQVVKATLVLR